jgi:hypothetical protein
MSMSDWGITNAIENLTGNWVYYIYTAGQVAYQNIHFSRYMDDPSRDHMATNDNQYYYYGFTGTYNTNDMPQDIREALLAAWNSYFSVW